MVEAYQRLREQLLEMDVAFITFSQYWYDDETLPLHAKAWTSGASEVKLSDFMWQQTRWVLRKVLKSIPVEANEKVFGWHVRSDALQMAAHNLEYTHAFGDRDLLDESAFASSEQAAREWGIAANPNYRYEISNDLQIMLEASQWSRTIVNAEALLEIYLHHKDEFVRSSLAANPSVSEDVLVKLAEDQSVFVRNSVRMNPSAPLWVKEAIGGYLE